MDKTLSSFITEIGEEKAAEIGQVTIRAIQAYRRHERTPRPEVAQRFVDTGEVTWEGIYAPRRSAA